MIVDVGRTCGRTWIKPFTNSDIQVPIRWYRTQPGAKVFPGLSFVALGYWAWRDYGWYGPGQAEDAPFTYDKGATPPTARGLGFCGTLDQFANGCEYDPNKPPMRVDAYGIAACCPDAGPPLPPPPPPIPMPVNISNVYFPPSAVQGRWYTGGQPYSQELVETAAIPPDTMLVVPFASPQGGTIGRIGAARLFNFAFPGALYRVGIYEEISPANRLPGALVFDSGDIDPNNPPRIDSVPCGVVLDQEKLYWLVISTNFLTGSMLGLDPKNLYPIFGYNDSVNVPPPRCPAAGGFSFAQVYGNLPAMFPGSPSQSDFDNFMQQPNASPLVQFA